LITCKDIRLLSVIEVTERFNMFVIIVDKFLIISMNALLTKKLPFENKFIIIYLFAIMYGLSFIKKYFMFIHNGCIKYNFDLSTLKICAEEI